MSVDLSQFSHLTVPQKLELVEALWDDIASSPESLPIPEWHKEELDRRKAELDANPGSTIPWEEAKRQIREGNGN
jgi:putative addiction module component (TIGR02574 family)